MVTDTRLTEPGSWKGCVADPIYGSTVALDQIGRSQVKTIEDDEIADELNDDSPFTYQDDIDPVEMAGFSIRRT